MTTHLDLRAVSLAYPLGGAGTTLGDPTKATRRFLRDGRGRVRGLKALEDVSLSLGQGDRLAIVGGNGAGKTTLLQVMAGILRPTTGTVARAGRTTNLINIGLGMQDEATGHRNVTLRGLAAGQTRAQIEARREEIAAFADLGEFLDLPVRTYSAGMRMRLNFAIATAFDPEILILDEWVSAGDAAFREKAAQRMEAFAERAGLLVLASHNLTLLKRVCDRAILLSEGRIAAEGAVDEIVDRYAPAKATKAEE